MSKCFLKSLESLKSSKDLKVPIGRTSVKKYNEFYVKKIQCLSEASFVFLVKLIIF